MSTFVVAPALTFAQTIAKARDGDTINVEPGIYPEDLYITKRLMIVAKSGAVVRSIHFAGITGGMLSGLEVVGPKTPLARPIDLTLPDDPSIPPIKGTLPKDQRDALAAKKWATVLAAQLAYDGPNQSAFTIGIKVSACADMTISDCRVTRHTAGFSVEKSSGIKVDASEASLCRVGFRAANGSTTITFSRLQATQNLGSGIELDGAHACTIKACASGYNGVHNYILHGKASRNVVTECTGSKAGWFSETMPWPGSSSFNCFDVGPGNVFSKNVAEGQRDATGNDGNGFIADTSANGVSFVGNVIRDCSGNGIALTKTNGNTVTGNAITGCKRGVNAGTTTGNTISGNTGQA